MRQQSDMVRGFLSATAELSRMSNALSVRNGFFAPTRPLTVAAQRQHGVRTFTCNPPLARRYY